MYIVRNKELRMLANTKQVRVIGNSVVGFGAQYTEKTSKYSAQRRSVVWAYSKLGVASTVAKLLQQEFAKLGYTNRVSVTQDQYVRVIANLG
jgi:hypothetical protein